MEDEYTIGIRLALDDGVTAGIAAISGDLTMLDRAMQGSVAGLARLRALGGATLPSMAAELGELARQGEQAAQLAVSPTSAEPLPMASPTIAIPERSTGGTAAIAAAPVVREAASVPVVAPLAPQAAPAAPVALAAFLPTAAPTVRILSPMSPPTVAARNVATYAPSPSTLTREEAAPATVTPPAERVIERQERVIIRRPKHINPMSTVIPAGPTTPVIVPGQTVQRGPSMSVAPVGVPPVGVSPSPSVTSLSSRGKNGPSQGDVLLDGTRVGRWMANVLAREATRPQGGSTLFDPRMGPSWPGTLQGG